MIKSKSVGITGILLFSFLLCFSFFNFFAAAFEKDSLISDFKNEDTLSGYVGDIDEFVEDNFLMRYSIINTYGKLQNLLGKNETGNFDIVRDRGGSLYSGNFFAGYGTGQKSLAVTARRFCDFSANCGSPAGVVLLPMKTVNPDKAIAGIPYDDRTKESALMSSFMRYYNVPYLDLSMLPDESGLGIENCFYKTDHHWTTPAAFNAYCRIIDWVNNSTDVKLPRSEYTVSLDNYSLEYYAQKMFGSFGRRIGTAYSGGLEDISVLLPKDDGEYSMQTIDGSKTLTVSGGFSETLVNLDFVSEVEENPYKESAYDLIFLSGLHDFCSVTNHNLPSAPRVLLINDSYSTVLGGLLAQNCSRLDMVYLLGDYADNLTGLIEENNYDLVLICLTETNFSEKNFRPLEESAYEQ